MLQGSVDHFKKLKKDNPGYDMGQYCEQHGSELDAKFDFAMKMTNLQQQIKAYSETIQRKIDSIEVTKALDRSEGAKVQNLTMESQSEPLPQKVKNCRGKADE